MCVSCMGAVCICRLSSSRIMPSCLAVVIKLPGFRDRIFSVRYPGLLFVVVGLLRPVANISVLALSLARFSEVCLGLCAML